MRLPGVWCIEVVDMATEMETELALKELRVSMWEQFGIVPKRRNSRPFKPSEQLSRDDCLRTIDGPRGEMTVNVCDMIYTF